MLKLFSTVLLFACARNLFAQAGSDELAAHAKQFIESVFNGADKPLLAAVKLDSFTIGRINDALSTDTFIHRSSHDHWKTAIADTFIISIPERPYTDSCIEDMYNFKWTTALLPNTTILDQQGIGALMAAGPDMPAYLKSHFKTDKFYWLAKPIFFRNYTYCIFYYETNNGKPGGDTPNMAIYVLVKKTWQKLMKINTDSAE